jgi:ribulose-5-phosphate 4-epimerase/fuculose-1-phosphate aldolase
MIQEIPDEGYIKYQCIWVEQQPLSPEYLIELNQYREQLYQLNLIGEDNQGIGYGNLSKRWDKKNQFIITGTQTGGLTNLNEAHYTLVTDFDIDANCLTCVGPIQASSEALTHGSIYEAKPEINAVIHIHHQQLWENLKYKVPTTPENCAYGTPEMARAIARLAQEQNRKIIVMSGHPGGLITFGNDLAEAANEIRLNSQYLVLMN